MSLQYDVNSLKFSALKVDVTSVASARRQPIVVVVASNVTRSRDVVRMVAQKLGLDRQDVTSMQLVAIVTYKPQYRISADHNGGCEEIVMLDDECPMSIFDEHPKHCVRFHLQWKHQDGLHAGENSQNNIEQTTRSIPLSACTNGAPVYRQSSPMYSSTPGSTPTGVCHTSPRAPAVTSRRHDNSLPWRHERPPVQPPDECLIQNERCTGSPGTHVTTNVWNGHDRSPGSVRVPNDLSGSQDPRPGLKFPAKFDDFGQRNKSSRLSDSSGSSNIEGHRAVDHGRHPNDPRSFHHQRGVRDCVGMRSTDPQGQRQQRCSADDRRARLDRRSHHRSDELYRPYFNLAAWTDIASKDWQPVRSNSASAGSTTGDSVDRALVKFSSLPDVSRLQKDSAGCDDARQTWRTEVEPLKCLDRATAFVSMPCISSQGLQRRRGCGRGLTPRRLLPTLSITEEAVEAKRKSMSQLLNERLKIASEKNGNQRHAKKSSKSKSKSQRHNGKQNVSSNCNSQIAAQHRKTNRAAAGLTAVIDDDCISVTSREVAAILSTAGPMAPPSDDEYDDHQDDVSDLEDDPPQMPSAMQLLRISSSCSSGSSTTANNSTGTHSLELATPPRNVNTTIHSLPVRLNNGSADAGQFRPKLNGFRTDVSTRAGKNGSEVGQGRDLTLFDLVRTYSLVVVTLEHRLNNGHHIRAAPFQVGNVVIDIPADHLASASSLRRTRLKLSVPGITAAPAKNRTDWAVTSSECVRPGDVIVEVNGANVISQSAVTVVALVLSSDCLDLVLARRPHSIQH